MPGPNVRTAANKWGQPSPSGQPSAALQAGKLRSDLLLNGAVMVQAQQGQVARAAPKNAAEVARQKEEALEAARKERFEGKTGLIPNPNPRQKRALDLGLSAVYAKNCLNGITVPKIVDEILGGLEKLTLEQRTPLVESINYIFGIIIYGGSDQQKSDFVKEFTSILHSLLSDFKKKSPKEIIEVLSVIKNNMEKIEAPRGDFKARSYITDQSIYIPFYKELVSTLRKIYSKYGIEGAEYFEPFITKYYFPRSDGATVHLNEQRRFIIFAREIAENLIFDDFKKVINRIDSSVKSDQAIEQIFRGDTFDSQYSDGRMERRGVERDGAGKSPLLVVQEVVVKGIADDVALESLLTTFVETTAEETKNPAPKPERLQNPFAAAAAEKGHALQSRLEADRQARQSRLEAVITQSSRKQQPEPSTQEPLGGVRDRMQLFQTPSSTPTRQSAKAQSDAPANPPRPVAPPSQSMAPQASLSTNDMQPSKQQVMPGKIVIPSNIAAMSFRTPVEAPQFQSPQSEQSENTGSLLAPKLEHLTTTRPKRLARPPTKFTTLQSLHSMSGAPSSSAETVPTAPELVTPAASLNSDAASKTAPSATSTAASSDVVYMDVVSGGALAAAPTGTPPSVPDEEPSGMMTMPEVGFANSGVTCYANSGIRLPLSNPVFVRFVLSLTPRIDAPFLTELKRVIIQNMNGIKITLDTLIRLSATNLMEIGRQSDAQEIMSAILDKVIEAGRSSPIEAEKEATEKFVGTMQFQLEQHLKHPDGRIGKSTLQMGLLVSPGNKEGATLEEQVRSSLKGSETLEDKTDMETVDGERIIGVEDIKKYVKPASSLPECLCVSVKLFSYEGSEPEKITRTPEFYSPTITVTDENDEDREYTMYAVSCQLGGIGCGHYEAIVSTTTGSTVFNDSQVIPTETTMLARVKEEIGRGMDPYLLVYVDSRRLEEYQKRQIPASPSLDEMWTQVDTPEMKDSIVGAVEKIDKRKEALILMSNYRVSEEVIQKFVDLLGEAEETEVLIDGVTYAIKIDMKINRIDISKREPKPTGHYDDLLFSFNPSKNSDGEIGKVSVWSKGQVIDIGSANRKIEEFEELARKIIEERDRFEKTLTDKIVERLKTQTKITDVELLEGKVVEAKRIIGELKLTLEGEQKSDLIYRVAYINLFHEGRILSGGSTAADIIGSMYEKPGDGDTIPETNHDYIQLLFPTKSKSSFANTDIFFPELHDFLVLEAATGLAGSGKLLQSAEIFARWLGFEHNPDGTFTVNEEAHFIKHCVRNEDIKAKYTHNFFRITRLLSSITSFANVADKETAKKLLIFRDSFIGAMRAYVDENPGKINPEFEESLTTFYEKSRAPLEENRRTASADYSVLHVSFTPFGEKINEIETAKQQKAIMEHGTEEEEGAKIEEEVLLEEWEDMRAVVRVSEEEEKKIKLADLIFQKRIGDYYPNNVILQTLKDQYKSTYQTRSLKDKIAILQQISEELKKKDRKGGLLTDYSMMPYFVPAGGFPSDRDQYASSEEEYREILNFIIDDLGADPQLIDGRSNTALLWAIWDGNPWGMNSLLSCPDVNVNIGDGIGFTPLHVIIAKGYYRTKNGEGASEEFNQLETILKRKDLDINARDNFGRHPLYIAILVNNLSIVERLMKDERLELNRNDIEMIANLLMRGEYVQDVENSKAEYVEKFAQLKLVYTEYYHDKAEPGKINPDQVLIENLRDPRFSFIASIDKLDWLISPPKARISKRKEITEFLRSANLRGDKIFEDALTSSDLLVSGNPDKGTALERTEIVAVEQQTKDQNNQDAERLKAEAEQSREAFAGDIQTNATTRNMVLPSLDSHGKVLSDNATYVPATAEALDKTMNGLISFRQNTRVEAIISTLKDLNIKIPEDDKRIYILANLIDRFTLNGEDGLKEEINEQLKQLGVTIPDSFLKTVQTKYEELYSKHTRDSQVEYAKTEAENVSSRQKPEAAPEAADGESESMVFATMRALIYVNNETQETVKEFHLFGNPHLPEGCYAAIVLPMQETLESRIARIKENPALAIAEGLLVIRRAIQQPEAPGQLVTSFDDPAIPVNREAADQIKYLTGLRQKNPSTLTRAQQEELKQFNGNMMANIQKLFNPMEVAAPEVVKVAGGRTALGQQLQQQALATLRTGLLPEELTEMREGFLSGMSVSYREMDCAMC